MFKDATKKKSINGKYYYFNAHGQMLYEWINTKGGNTIDSVVADAQKASLDSLEEATPSEAQQVKSGIVGDMRYANQVEDGSRTDGWYEIAGSEDARSDGDTDWYFFDKGEAQKASVEKNKDLVATKLSNGKYTAAKDGDNYVYRARIKCDGKYFCFNELGQMQTGLQWINGYLYFFDDNGYMKTGKVADVEEENNDIYTYYFITKTGGNGQGKTGPQDGYLYWNGKRLEADDDYALYQVEGETYLVNNKGKIQKTKKDYALDANGGNDVYIEISNSHVTKIAVDENGYLTDERGNNDSNVKSIGSVRNSLVDNEMIWIPYIYIYDNILAPENDYIGDKGIFWTEN